MRANLPQRSMRFVKHSSSTAFRRQNGVSLIEVLIAMLLVALGTLAIVALQLSSKRNTIDAAQRAEAAQLGANLLERMRANNTRAALSAYLVAAGNGFGGGKQSAPGTDCSTSTADCSDVQLAFHDAWLFEQTLDGVAVKAGTDTVAGLISPRACLTANPSGGVSATYTLTLVWRGLGAVANDTAVTCGSGTSDYGDNDSLRRVMTLTSFIASR